MEAVASRVIVSDGDVRIRINWKGEGGNLRTDAVGTEVRDLISVSKTRAESWERGQLELPKSERRAQVMQIDLRTPPKG